MNYFSTNRQVPATSFAHAVIEGLAADKGLFMPETIPALSPDFFTKLPSLSLPEIGFEIARNFVGDEITESDLSQICEEALNFEIPLNELDAQTHILELFHGPTLAFKDVGARFMSRIMSHLLKNETKKVIVLAATSGDTGSAVAQGFYQVPGVEVVVLYPSGKVSQVQEAQFCTLGKNITALEVTGTFDDCQRLVKTAFADTALREKLYLTSANSINIARLLPQSFYYFYAYQQFAKKYKGPFVFSIPSGNYGNLTAGLFAWKMGLPIHHFVAASNANDTVPVYLETAHYTAKPSVSTLSSAMDVGDPSNFARMREIFGDSWETMKQRITGFRFSDAETRKAIEEVYKTYNYLIDPHGAVGYLALKKYQKEVENVPGVVLATAHPVKFSESVTEVTGQQPPVPESLAVLLDKPKKSIPLPDDYQLFKEFLLSKNS
ncbi:threonine synthase [Cytophagaceae bacterium DM2B3-1]|uniref:Threonine synthase n=1 Tax=Xanthocytophaga flava TaxID=3048013 RepID=A0ABT7CJ47_9BACT|nr:threonine synthase [Xanthocytophaga flavus]MDJ1493758.1 threonine synthase [Xanthocytophaga flavus]